MDLKPHARLDEETRDRAALYLLGGMGSEEASDFEKHLEVCAACGTEVSSLSPLIDDLVLMGPEVEPPPGLRERVLERARATTHTLHPEAERAWVPADVPGVSLCQLWLDAANERQTILVRMEAGHQNLEAQLSIPVIFDDRLPRGVRLYNDTAGDGRRVEMGNEVSGGCRSGHQKPGHRGQSEQIHFSHVRISNV